MQCKILWKISLYCITENLEYKLDFYFHLIPTVTRKTINLKLSFPRTAYWPPDSATAMVRCAIDCCKTQFKVARSRYGTVSIRTITINRRHGKTRHEKRIKTTCGGNVSAAVSDYDGKSLSWMRGITATNQKCVHAVHQLARQPVRIIVHNKS